MVQWLIQNAATIIVSFFLIILIIAVICKLIRDKRNNKTYCSCGCGGCAMQGSCTKKNKKHRS